MIDVQSLLCLLWPKNCYTEEHGECTEGHGVSSMVCYGSSVRFVSMFLITRISFLRFIYHRQPVGKLTYVRDSFQASARPRRSRSRPRGTARQMTSISC
jgi:hypothetical protein